MGDAGKLFDSDFIRHTASAVLHYFKHDLRRETVSLVEFATALEKALRGLMQASVLSGPAPSASKSEILSNDDRSKVTDLCRLGFEAGCELLFFARLREELRRQLSEGRLLRFRALRPCVKILAGAQRWSPRCQSLEAQIVAFLRKCLEAEPRREESALVIG